MTNEEQLADLRSKLAEPNLPPEQVAAIEDAIRRLEIILAKEK